MAKIDQFVNGEGGLSVRTKINEAIKSVEVDSTLSGDGNIASSLGVVWSGVNSDFLPTSDSTYVIGSGNTAFKDIYIKGRLNINNETNYNTDYGIWFNDITGFYMAADDIIYLSLSGGTKTVRINQYGIGYNVTPTATYNNYFLGTLRATTNISAGGTITSFGTIYANAEIAIGGTIGEGNFICQSSTDKISILTGGLDTLSTENISGTGFTYINSVLELSGTTEPTPGAGRLYSNIDGHLYYSSGDTFIQIDNPAVSVSWDAVDGNLIPTSGNTIDIGSGDTAFKDLYLEGIAYVNNITEFNIGSGITFGGNLYSDKIIIDQNQNYGINTGLWFGDGNTGIYESENDTLIFTTNTFQRLSINNSEIVASVNFYADASNQLNLGTTTRNWLNLYLGGSIYNETTEIINISGSSNVDFKIPIRVNTINELDINSGVTIEGVELKDGDLTSTKSGGGLIQSVDSDTGHVVSFKAQGVNEYVRAAFLLGDEDNNITNGALWVAPAGTTQEPISLEALTNTDTVGNNSTKRIGLNITTTKGVLYTGRAEGNDGDIPLIFTTQGAVGSSAISIDGDTNQYVNVHTRLKTDYIYEYTASQGIIIGNDVSILQNLTIAGNISVTGTYFTSSAETFLVTDNLAVINYGETSAGVTLGFAGWEVDRGTLTPYRWGFSESSDTFELGEYYIQLTTGTITGGPFTIQEEILQENTGARGYIYSSDQSTFVKIKGTFGTFDTSNVISGLTSNATFTPTLVTINDSLQAVATRQDTPTDTGVAFWNSTTTSFETHSGLKYVYETGILNVNIINESTDTLGVTIEGVELKDGGIKLVSGSTINTIETILTNDNTHIPTSSAVVDAIAQTSQGWVNTTGTPINNQLAIFTDDNTIEGVTGLTFDGTNLGVGVDFSTNKGLYLIKNNTTGSEIYSYGADIRSTHTNEDTDLNWLIGIYASAEISGVSNVTNLGATVGGYFYAKNLGTGYSDELIGIYAKVDNNSNNASNNNLRGHEVAVYNSGVVNRIVGAQYWIEQDGLSATADYISGVQVSFNANKGSVTNLYGIELGLEHNWTNNGGTVDNSYAIYIDESTNIGNILSYAIYSASTGTSYFAGSITGSTFVKTGGLSTEFLKADGSVDTNTYLLNETDTFTGTLTVEGIVSINPSVTPSSALHVQPSTASTDLARFFNSDYTTGVGSGLRIYSGAISGDTYMNIQVYDAGATSTNNLILQGIGGYVGIGTTAPERALHVLNNSFNLQAIFERTSANSDGAVAFRNDATSWTIGVDGSDSDKFKISNNFGLGTNDFLTIDTTGYVNIRGLTALSPSSTLFVGGTGVVVPTVSGSNSQFLITGNNNAIEFGTPDIINAGYAWILARHRQVAASGGYYSTLHLQPVVTGTITDYEGVAIGYDPTTKLASTVGLAVAYRLGVGMTAPNNMVDITDTNFVAATQNAGLSLRGGSSGSGLFSSAIGFRMSNTSGQRASIAGVQGTSDDDQMGLAFFIHPSSTGTDAQVEAMRISYDGKVGIGTTDATSPLHIYQDDTATTAGAGLTIEQDGTGDVVIQFLLTGLKRWVVGVDNSDGDKFKIASSIDLDTDDRLVIDTDGKVGTGTSTPFAKNHIVGSNETFRLSSDNANEAINFRFTEAKVNDNYQGAFINYDGVNNILNIGVHQSSDALVANDVNAISIDRTTGRVGILTTGATTALDVNGVITATDGTSTQWNTAYTNRWEKNGTDLYYTEGSVGIGISGSTYPKGLDLYINDNSSHSYGAYFHNFSTGSNNYYRYGLYSKAEYSGTTTQTVNYGASNYSINRNSARIEFGLGTDSRVYRYDNGTANNLYGTSSTIYAYGTGTIDDAFGYFTDVQTISTSSSNITRARGLYIKITNASTTNTISEATGISVGAAEAGSKWTNSGTVTLSQGIYIDNSIDIGITKYAINSQSSGTSFFAGNMNFGGQTYFNLDTLTDAASITTDCNKGNYHTVTLTDNRILAAPSNPQIGTHIWKIVQDAGGTNTLDLSAFTILGSTTAINLTGSSVSILTGLYDGSIWYMTILT